ncbi:MAG: transcriptional regulator [Gammaproteobacteria bacterium]|nr:MAG: transcriptional regulator [Gammaproteobacteria bacterium]RLA37112.1 MAG: transcriptional regulator [Gammaproteobacteria bacterium]
MEIPCRQFFQLLADDTRLRCLLLIQHEGELCVCELVHALGVIQPKISRHLAALRNEGVVTDRRAGQWVHYRLHPDLPAWAHAVLVATAVGAEQRQPFISDRDTLAQMPNRPGAARCA